MQISIADDDILSVTYTCGKRSESIDVQEHGVTHTVWKLLDNMDKHIGQRPKIVCKVCDGEQSAFDKMLASFGDLDNRAKDAADAFTVLAGILNKIKKEKVNDQEGSNL